MTHRLPHNLPRISGPLAAGLTAGGAAAAAALTAGVLAYRAGEARKQRPTTPPLRAQTGGCDPDLGPYLDAPLYVNDVDGTHQGIGVAMLRERFLNDDPGLDPFSAEYAEILHSLVEVALNLALNLAENEFDTEDHDCGDPDCEGGSPDFELLALVAGRRMTEFAISFDRSAREHAVTCKECAKAGHKTPAFIRAQFCRDIADDLLTNVTDSGAHIQGLPISAAFDVLSSMIEVGEKGYGRAIEDQIEELNNGLLLSIQHVDEHHSHEEH